MALSKQMITHPLGVHVHRVISIGAEMMPQQVAKRALVSLFLLKIIWLPNTSALSRWSLGLVAFHQRWEVCLSSKKQMRNLSSTQQRQLLLSMFKINTLVKHIQVQLGHIIRLSHPYLHIQVLLQSLDSQFLFLNLIQIHLALFICFLLLLFNFFFHFAYLRFLLELLHFQL